MRGSRGARSSTGRAAAPVPSAPGRAFRARGCDPHREGPMRRGVAILTSLFPPSVGGIQTQTLSLARELAARGEEVHVVTRPSAGLPAVSDEGGIVVHRTGLTHAPPPAASIAYVAAAAGVVASLAGRLAVVHAHQLLSPATAALVARAVRR